ncbi:MAG: nucleotidyltransferase family protein [Bacteroidales bacterium]|nr:nucleotidyltransferase family protein [Bacteroidales bacterium]
MTNNKTDVVILAGGLGTRLRSVVSDRPKCMAPVNGRPFLSYLLDYLSQYSIGKVVLSVGYLHEVVMEWVEQRKGCYPFAIDYAVEDVPLGTGGGIRLAMQRCTADTVCVMNGDTFFEVNMEGLLKAHRQGEKPVTMALKHLTDFDRYGTVSVNDEGVVTQFNEKQYCADGLINAGFYVLDNNGQLDDMPEKFSFENLFLHPKADEGVIQGFVSDGYFIDIGIPEDYEKAMVDFKRFEELWASQR